jgi:hypothetical protein
MMVLLGDAFRMAVAPTPDGAAISMVGAAAEDCACFVSGTTTGAPNMIVCWRGSDALNAGAAAAGADAPAPNMMVWCLFSDGGAVTGAAPNMIV